MLSLLRRVRPLFTLGPIMLQGRYCLLCVIVCVLHVGLCLFVLCVSTPPTLPNKCGNPLGRKKGNPCLVPCPIFLGACYLCVLTLTVCATSVNMHWLKMGNSFLSKDAKHTCEVCKDSVLTCPVVLSLVVHQCSTQFTLLSHAHDSLFPLHLPLCEWTWVCRRSCSLTLMLTHCSPVSMILAVGKRMDRRFTPESGFILTA